VTVRLWVGAMGSGKTLGAVMDLYGRRKRSPDLPIMTNLGRLDLPGIPVELISVEMGLDEMFQAMLAFRQGVLLLDEAGVFLPSRMWHRVPLELSAKWAQLRKDGVDLYITALWTGSIVKDLREIVMQTTSCSSYRRFGFFVMTSYSGTMVGNKRFFETRAIRFFRPGLAGKLYDTLGKVKAPDWGGRAHIKVGETGDVDNKSNELDGGDSGHGAGLGVFAGAGLGSGGDGGRGLVPGAADDSGDSADASGNRGQA